MGESIFLFRSLGNIILLNNWVFNIEYIIVIESNIHAHTLAKLMNWIFIYICVSTVYKNLAQNAALQREADLDSGISHIRK